MGKLYMFIGLPASGKTTYAQALVEKEGAIWLSSDKVREELFDSEDTQGDNNKVFQTLHNRIYRALSEGKDVIYDATNISSKRRQEYLKSINKLNCKKIAILFATPYEECLRRNNERERKVPEEVIKRMYMNFNVPCYQEGWDEIKIIYANTKFIEYKQLPLSMKDISHCNPHHTASIGEHMILTYKYLCDTYPNLDDDALEYAAFLHDIGKPFTMTFDLNGIAHFYQHNCVGAYDVLLTDIPEELKLDVALLIQYHMNYYMNWKQSEKTKEKDTDFLSEDFIRRLDILHDCDLHGE